MINGYASSTEGEAPSETVVPALASGPCAVGENRLVVLLSQPNGSSVAAPDRSLTIQYRHPAATARLAGEPSFVWAVEGVLGAYVMSVTLPVSGLWALELRLVGRGQDGAAALVLQVEDEARGLRAGMAAPVAGSQVDSLTTDLNPTPAFYRDSISALVEASVPFVVVFATPGLCRLGVCAALLGRIKTVAARHPVVRVIHEEPYALVRDGAEVIPEVSEDGGLSPTPNTRTFLVQVEPTVYSVSRAGIVTKVLEFTASDDELDLMFRALSP
jgi:hypothetical protein